ncbi:DEAD/DEAH box helicase [Leptotrichia sp. OH3620_COT-345]|uniref:DEAD/DEAH box helicase n=1 Tax=Leptotrichia sp. OH3620_COT-345 TaxID=2491048 RepID=UPI000F64654F|nr:DEAD/DEAH box helicase [Leptotrichia sp. OH3620_COT-345]RRD40475.1 DEAD/DEAH box helicase [Leptotrichia sp. OH3620_COT-345]
MQKFEDYGLSREVLDALEKKGFEEPSDIQKLVIPELLKERTHLIGQAQTGTGKTAAFSIPILETLEPDKTVKALILAPTRELANQVADEIYSLKGKKDIKVLAVYGGASIENQIKKLKSGVDIVVGTPGRVMDLMRKKVLKVNNLDYFVLDEADEMLNMGFIEDIELILEETNDEKKMLFFSATIPKTILSIAKKFMSDYKLLKVKKEELTTDLTEQIYYEVKQEDKFEALCRVLDYEQNFYGIVFCRTKSEVDEVTNKLKARNYDAECIHGDITQGLRQKALDLFKKKILTILVATDVAARGIDVSNLTHVINYSIPQEAESYVHRIGRTGRAGHKGIAITFVTPREASKLSQIKRVTKTDIKRESIPNVKEILNAKKEALIAYIDEIIKEEDYVSYEALADKLIEGREPKQVLASILRHVYEDEFLPESYSEIEDVKVKIEDKTRLFIALGSKDGYNPGRLLDLLNKKAKTPGRKVKDIKIMDKYSFITVPLQEAEYIIRALNSKKDSKPLVEKATGGQSSGKSDSKKSGNRSKGRKKSGKETDKKSKDKKTTSKSKEKTKKSEKSSSKKKKSK